MPRRDKGKRKRRWAVGAVMVAVPVGLAGVVMIGGSGAPTYRIASVERADVDATLDLVGTIQPINQVSLSFPVSGTVRSVSASVGQHVSVGQILAQLDTTSLDAQVASAQSAVAAAQARLAADQSSQTVTTTVAPTAFSTEIAPGNTPSSPATSSPEPPSPARDLLAQQQAVLLTDQHRADQDTAQEKRDLTTESSLCQSTPTSAESSPRTASSRRSQSTVVPARGDKTPQPSDAGTCESAIATVLADQAAVENDQHTVTADLATLSATLDKLMTPSPTPHPTPTPRPSRTPPPTTATSGTANRIAPAPRPASAEQLAADQAAIDAAQAQLTDVQQAHNQAELRSPIEGTIGSVTINAGQAVQGSSSAPQVVIIGPGAHQVTTTVSDTTMGSLRVGDTATVMPSGGSAPLGGQVVSIGLLATSSSTGSVSYPVTIGLTSSGEQLFPGQSASVSIMLAHAPGTLTVPSSAVHHLGATSTVTVLRNGTPSSVPVSLGAIGPTRTQVLAGLNPGDQVILADLSRPLPTTGIQNIRRITGGAGGRPGG